MPPGGKSGAPYNNVMKSTVAFLKEHNFGYLKVDSGGPYNDMQLWHDLIKKSGNKMTIENCHQGGEPPNVRDKKPTGIYLIEDPGVGTTVLS